MHFSDNNLILFICRALLPLAEALSNVPTAGFLRSDPNPEQVTFVFDYTRYMSEYGQIIGVALDNAPAGSVPMPRLRKLLKPLTVGGVCITQLENIFMARLRGRDQPNINAQWEKIDPAHWAHVFARVITWVGSISRLYCSDVIKDVWRSFHSSNDNPLVSIASLWKALGACARCLKHSHVICFGFADNYQPWCYFFDSMI